ncbi:MAG: SBBP repeat-containing protein [Bacteroidetes bacterium]|nr:SBBP repeat-containing protein [Bacteroidota bacterium]
MAAPGTLTYSKQTARYARNYVVQNNTPSATGGSPSSYSISPSLPSGLSFNTSTGVISGTPTSISAAANYTVTATNVSGSATRVLSIEIAEPWTRFTSGDSSTAAYYLATVSDTSGNVYATGRSNKGMDGNTHSSARASGNIILTESVEFKRDWALDRVRLEREGGFGANPNGMTIDSNSNLYITGEATGNIDGVTKTGNSDMLLIKYDSNGNKIWTRLLGSAGANIYGTSIVADSANNVYIAGVTNGHLDAQTRTGTRDLFVTKYNSSGTRQWTRLLGAATFVTEAYAIAIDSSSSVYVTGVTYGGLDGNTRVGSRDMYVVKYDSSGNKQWTYQMGAATNPVSAISEGRGITVDQSGYIYVTGHTYGNFDSNARTGAVDVFIMKLNSAGAKQFSAQYGKAGSGLLPQSLTVDTSGNLYVAGWTDTQGIGSIAQIGSKDAFVARFSPSGSFEWAATKGVAASEAIAYSVATNAAGEVIVCGSSSAGFDNNTISGTGAFVTKLNTAGFQQ